ncbi:MAG: adenylate/guanylate cyclase domain-containing protein [Candidatus Bathyarchaeia archaeon]|jgi:class 3 adenylate cyclase
MPAKKRPFRMDFIQEVVSFDEKTGKAEVILTPNPARYEFKVLDGQEGYYDIFDDLFISVDQLKKILPKLDGMPFFYSPPKIDDADQFIKERIPHIREYLCKKNQHYKFEDASEEFLKGLERDQLCFVVLSIDLKGSTKMSQEIDSEKNAIIITLFLSEMATIVGVFNGFVLKYVGDGLIAYFPEPNMVGMTDNALDCAVTMKKLILFGLNPILAENGLPKLNFRIGLDSGEAIVKTVGAKSVKIHKDLISETINLSCKIQSIADTNQILMGESTALFLHTFWRKKIQKIKIKEWGYKNRETGEVYPLFALNENW